MAWNPETNIRGPQGPKGDKGDPGSSGSGSGNVNGPASPPTVTDDIVLWAGTDGTTIKDSTKKIADLVLKTEFNEISDARVAAFLVAGSNITLTYSDPLNTLTIASTATGGPGSMPEPADNNLYGRANNAGTGEWRRAVAVAGDTMTGALVIKPASGSASFWLDKAASGDTNSIQGRKASLTRWQMQLGNGTVETGAPVNTGSDFQLSAYDDAGNFLSNALMVYRANGNMTLGGGMTLPGTLATSGVITSSNTTAAGSGAGAISTQGGISAAGAVKAFSKGSQLGVAGGTPAGSVVADTDANVLFYRGSADNWAGIGVDNGGNTWFRVGSAAGLKPSFYLAASSTNVVFQSFINGPQASFTLPSGTVNGYALVGSISGSPAAQGGVHSHNGTQYVILTPPGKAGLFSGAVDVIGNLDVNGTIDISSTSTFRNTATFMSTATFNTAVNGAATVSFPNIDATGNAGAANVVVIATSGRLLKSTSSLAYKTDIEPMWNEVADKLLTLTPIFYRSKIKQVEMEGKEHYSWYSFGAETLAAADPRFAAWGVAYQYDEYGEPIRDADGQPLAATEETPQGINWNALTAGLVNLVQRLEKRIAALEAQQGPAPS